jgi:glycine hydroxymethyltransferase
MIITKEEFAEKVDKMLFPGLQGGPLENIIAAKAVAFEEASKPEFKTYAEQILKNAKALAEELQNLGYKLVSGGTDNHLLNIDFGSDGITGKDAEGLLEQVNLIVNREVLPNDTRKPFIASGIRLGTSTVTTQGMKEEEMKKIANLIDLTLKSNSDEKELESVRFEVASLVKQFPFED